MWTISSRGSPRPRIRSAAVVTVDRSTLSSFTGTVGGRSKAARKPCGLSRPMSFKVASNVIAMRDSPLHLPLRLLAPAVLLHLRRCDRLALELGDAVAQRGSTLELE